MLVPDAGLEPACLAATAFEAAASAGSANRASGLGCVVGIEPTTTGFTFRSAATAPHAPLMLVSAERFELPTPCSQSTCAANCATRRNETGSRGWKRSSDLPVIDRVLCRLSYATTRNWLRSVGSNHGPSP
jgi:hypothetical protein